MSVVRLAHVALAVSDLAPVARLLGDVLGLERDEARTPDGRTVPLFRAGESSLAVFAVDDPYLEGEPRPGVRHVALSVVDPLETARAASLATRGEDPVSGLDGAPEVRLDPQATCGVRTRLCAASPRRSPAGARVERIDHVGVACADNAAATAVFSTGLGLAVESTQTDLEVHTAMESFTSDKYGVVYHTRAPEIAGGLRVSFLTAGDCELELLEPFAPSGDAQDAPGAGPGTTRGDKGAIGRFIGRRGPGLHHLALKTPDIDATLAAVAAAGYPLIDGEGRPGSRRARIGFPHPMGVGGLLLHFVERHER